jgi:hexosaminidase
MNSFDSSRSERPTPVRRKSLRPLPTILVTASLLLGASRIHAEGTGNLMPLPARQTLGSGELVVSAGFSVDLPKNASRRLHDAATRLLAAWSRRSGLAFAEPFAGSPQTATLSIECARPGSELPLLSEDESYTLLIDQKRAVLRAPQDAGALRGLATLTQLLAPQAAGWSLPALTINDAPRFAWRGLLIDVCRHWQPLEVILRNLDAMALVKLNVLHLHLSDDQAFRVESKTHPALHQQGSDGNYYSQEDIKKIIAYAAARSIRVVPEFDIPGHATSWVTAYPELASVPGPYQLKRYYGVFDAVLDPTNEKTYAVVNEVLGEMGDLFPDKFMHIGGDENNGNQWNANPAIQDFIRQHNLKDNAGLHAYFNQRINAFLVSRGKHMIGWDEILHPDLPRDTVVESWRGPDGIVEASVMGFSGIRANGYYIDHCRPASEHYLNDPLPADGRLSADERARVLGGEATMWSELVSAETIDSRIWPRTAAIAERFWSPENIRDVEDMYRRLAIVRARLSEAGVRHDSNHRRMINYLVDLNTPAKEREAVETFVGLLEPDGYARLDRQIWINQDTPLVGLADVVRPDSRTSREWMKMISVDTLAQSLFAQEAIDGGRANAWMKPCENWREASRIVLDMSARWQYVPLRETKVQAQRVAAAAQIALEAIDALATKKTLGFDWRAQSLGVLDQAAAKELSGTLIPFLPAVRLLTIAASEPASKNDRSLSEWKTRLEALAESHAP